MTLFCYCCKIKTNKNFSVQHFKDIRAVYNTTGITETTPCHTTESFLRNGSMHFKSCNYSYWNNMMPWICVKPENRKLSCNDWKGYTRSWSTYLKELNECELQLAQR